MRIHVRRGQHKYGPYSLQEAKAFLEDGRLLMTDRAWQEGVDEPLQLRELVERRSSAVELEAVPDARAAVVQAISAARDTGASLARKTKALMERRDDKGVLGYVQALVFPFRQQRWKERIWWLPFIGFVPVIDLIVLRGWRLDVVRRFSRDDARLLPDIRDAAGFVFDGVVLWTMTFIFTVIPLIIIIASGSGVLTSLAEIGSWCLSFLKDEERMALTELLAQEGSRLGARLAIEGGYFVVAWPIYRAGMIRYAATGKVLSFFRIFRNALFVLSNAGEFVKMGLYVIPTWIMMATLGALLTATGFGALLVPAICLPLYYWSTAFEYGHLASILVKRLK